MTDPLHDPISQLEQEHETMRRLFADWRAVAARGAPHEQRRLLAEQICLELAIHTRLEEELLYPLAREAVGNPELLDQALEEHATARELMRPVLLAREEGDAYDAQVAALCQYVEHHMAHEAHSLFPQLRRCGADLALLGRRLRERRRELEAVKEALREDALVSSVA